MKHGGKTRGMFEVHSLHSRTLSVDLWRLESQAFAFYGPIKQIGTFH